MYPSFGGGKVAATGDGRRASFVFPFYPSFSMCPFVWRIRSRVSVPLRSAVTLFPFIASSLSVLFSLSLCLSLTHSHSLSLSLCLLHSLSLSLCFPKM
ncbi:hypothetical protein DFJ73DRAFT_810961, partial [Zopfochytrium polystomum]